MEKFCIFCGNAPEDKNKEHVLPKWLIKLTGDPKRIGQFGADFSRPPFSIREFSFDSFTFPACSDCNNRFSKLESSVQPIVEGLLAADALDENQFAVLLDWLDKIRVGLWLGYHYLDKNPLGIKPKFHIESRMGFLDRMVGVLATDRQSTGLTFIGPQSKFYELSPTHLALRINSLWLLNASGVSLCSPRLGFPFAEPIRINDEQQLEVAPRMGSSRVISPVERTSHLANTVTVYQPIFRQLLGMKEGKKYIENEWVKKHTLNSELGHGELFLQKQGAAQSYPQGRSLEWVPAKAWDSRYLPRLIAENICARLRNDFAKAIHMTASKEHRNVMRGNASAIRRMDRALLKKMRAGMY